ncbi:NAD(P)-binding protein [Sporormia fimetaria CBS 119925]|uniref:NAD(P)-binding protein n=1 Tax=Sporormia fimetaria CBS 119925 TaxID=1340428 RepID=A0A6A6V017_9PLEO|nr:NAD(P)-binding protein [Sporormia fimetaria CBS 119925]
MAFPSPTKTYHKTSYPSISPTLPAHSAKGKSILVTGGGTGIGAATAHSFARAGAARIALIGRRLQPLLDTKASIEKECSNVEVWVKSVDVTDHTAVSTAFSEFCASAPLDILIANAAVLGPVEPFTPVSTSDAASAITTNVTGAINVGQAFLQHAAENAVLIDVSSGGAYFNLKPGLMSYGVSKLATFRVFDVLGFENPGIRVHHMQPGVVETDLSREGGGKEFVADMDDVSLPADFQVWLASPEGEFLKGKFVWANWDVDELKARKGEIEGSTLFDIGHVGFPFSEDFSVIPKRV